MEVDKRSALLRILNDVRNMNDLQRENRKSVVQMRDTIDYYQELFESITSDNKATDKSVIREIRIELLRLSILANPATQELFRSKKKPPVLIGEVAKRLPTTNIPRQIIESIVKHQPESHYLTSTGFISLDPNVNLLVELLNPKESDKAVQISTVSGGGSGLATIELSLDSNLLNTGELMAVRNSNTALDEKGSLIARLSTESINEAVNGELIYCMTQVSSMSTIDIEQLILAPGHSLTVRMINRTNQSNFVGLNFSWWELPPVERSGV